MLLCPWGEGGGPSEVAALLPPPPPTEGAGVRLRPVDDGPLLQAAGGERGAQREWQATCPAAECPVQDAPRHLPLPLQLRVQQEPENQQVGSPHPRPLVSCVGLAA